MALNISGYVDPGVYVGETIVPGAVASAGIPLTVCIIGAGSRTKRATNEAVVRGAVSNETLTVDPTPGSYTASFFNRSDRKTANIVITATVGSTTTTLSQSDWSLLPASIVGPGLTTLDFTAPSNKIALSLDGKTPVTLVIQSGGSNSVSANGSVLTVTRSGVTINALTPQQIADAINAALSSAAGQALGYGPAYGSVATVSSNRVVLTSPLNTPLSSVVTYDAYPSTESKTAAVFGSPGAARTTILIADSAWNPLATYKASYVAVNTDVDAVAQSTISNIVRVGSYVGTSNYLPGVDYTLTGVNIDWSVDQPASFTASVSGPYNLSTNDIIVLSLDGRQAVQIDLNGMASPPPGYANPGSPAAATPAEVANNINAVLAGHEAYGPQYAGVASVSGGRIVLTSPTQGIGSFVQISAPSSNSAVTTIFGLLSSQLPYEVRGTGSRPQPGITYFVSYDYARPASDYNVPKRFFTPDSLHSDIGYPSPSNLLAVAADIAFENGAPSVIVIQVNDSVTPGSPTQNEFLAAINAASTTSSITDVVVLSTAVGVQVDLMTHLEAMNSPTQKNYRRGWFGMAAGTPIGDRDTPDTLIYRAVRTLQVSPTSPARGRMFLVAPGGVTRTITLEDGSETDVVLSGAFAAVAVAAKMSSFTSAADTLLRKTVSGFRADNFPTYLKTERALLASNGVLVITADAGKLVLLDPVSTEAGGGKLIQFMEPSASVQKDTISIAIQQQVDANLVGVVPTDLATFLTTIKGYIATALRSKIADGSIGPYRTADGVTRDIDLAKDIQVFQDSTDPTKYLFRYWFNLRYPAKRFFGDYSVDRAFF
jgi:hypothetical protein